MAADHRSAAVPTAPSLDSAQIRRTAIRGVLCVMALSFACNLGVLAVPLFNMQVFNRVLTTRNIPTLTAMAGGLAIMLVAYAVLDVLRGLALEAAAGRVTRQLSLPLVQSVAAGGRGAGAAAEALTDLERLHGFFSSSAPTAPFDLMWAPLLLAVLLSQHWAYAVFGVVCITILAVMNVLGDAMSRHAMLAANQTAAGAMRGAADAVGAAEVVLANGMLPALTGRWTAAQGRAHALVHRALTRSRTIASINSALRMAMTGAMVGLGLVLALNGLASGGSMVAGNMILAKLLLPFQSLSSTRRSWVDALAAWRRIRAVLEQTTAPRYAHALPRPSPRLVVDRAVYMPPGGDRPLLRGVSFTAEPGECVGIVGPSAAGKSSLLRLVMGMVPPTAGGAFLDGTGTYHWEREDFSRHVGYVPQRLVLLDGTVTENICRLGRPDVAALLEASKRAGLHRIVAGLPQGYATRIAGATLSSGQRQRVALARALYTRPGLLVLDEPTAFLDGDGEAEFVRLLARLRAEGTTILLVTHRPALLAAADRLIVLQDGAVAQSGPPAALLDGLTGQRVRPTTAAREPALSGGLS